MAANSFARTTEPSASSVIPLKCAGSHLIPKVKRLSQKTRVGWVSGEVIEICLSLVKQYSADSHFESHGHLGNVYGQTSMVKWKLNLMHKVARLYFHGRANLFFFYLFLCSWTKLKISTHWVHSYMYIQEIFRNNELLPVMTFCLIPPNFQQFIFIKMTLVCFINIVNCHAETPGFLLK